MEKPLSGSAQKIEEYVNRIQSGESKEDIFNGLPESFKTTIEERLGESSEEKEIAQKEKEERYQVGQLKIDELRNKLGITESAKKVESLDGPPVNYTEIVIDDEYMKKNLMPNGGLRMQGGQANWNGEVDLMRYVVSEKLSPQYLEIALDKIEKQRAGEEKIYQHESHHIQNRNNELTPHVAAENLREFLAFRVLDELSAFATGELYNQDITAENILLALKIAEQHIINSYYGKPFSGEAQWYISQHGKNPNALSREINQEKYHKIMRQYFTIKGQDVLAVLQKENKISEFTTKVNDLILKLDNILSTVSA
jgi:hypothetical protein